MKILAIAMNTGRETVRSRILYSILFFALFVVALAGLFGSVSVGDPMKFVKDFSLMSISLFGVVIAIVTGGSLLHKELGKRTILNVLSKPVARWQFLTGKFLGLLTTLALVVGLMCACLVTFFALVEGRVDGGLILAALASLLELMIVVAVALFFSSIVVTPTLAGILTAATFVAGRSSAYLHNVLYQETAPFLASFLRCLYWVLPHLDRFNISDEVVYGNYLTKTYFVALAGYAAAYSGCVLLLSMALFSRREFR